MKSIVDRLAEIRAVQKELAEEESALRQALLDTKQNVVEGERFTAILKLVPQSRLDSDHVKKDMGVEWYKSHCKVTQSLRIETIAKAA